MILLQATTKKPSRVWLERKYHQIGQWWFRRRSYLLFIDLWIEV